MAKIEQVGVFDVTIIEAYVGELAPNDKHPETRYQVVLIGQTEAGDTGTWYGSLSRNVVRGGKYKGKYAYQATMRTLGDLGFAGEDPFDIDSPVEKGGLIGAPARMSVEASEYNGKTTHKVAFVWPANSAAKKVDKDQRASVWDAITGGSSAPAPKLPEEPEIDEASLLGQDEIPF